VKLTSVAIFAAGYVLGTRAGRERYAQIVDAVEQASQRLEAFSSRHTPNGHREGPQRAEGGS
jgi:alpha-D-ribose 1-methylphosphonate 5-triphosphate synthase subunit PhnG